jgi:anti-sigma factor RsiW
MTSSTSDDNSVLLVHAYLDGELDPANALEIEQRMSNDPALAAEGQRVKALRPIGSITADVDGLALVDLLPAGMAFGARRVQ